MPVACAKVPSSPRLELDVEDGHLVWVSKRSFYAVLLNPGLIYTVLLGCDGGQKGMVVCWVVGSPLSVLVACLSVLGGRRALWLLDELGLYSAGEAAEGAKVVCNRGS